MHSFIHSALRSLARQVLICLPAALFFVSLPASAEEGRFLADDLYIHDTVAGLTWSRETNPGDDRLVSFEDAFVFVALLNKEQFGGFSDWRVPDIEELKKLASGVRAEAANDPSGKDLSGAELLERAGFRNVRTQCWSSTTSFFNVADAWTMNMVSGKTSVARKTHYNCVWPVRTSRSGH